MRKIITLFVGLASIMTGSAQNFSVDGINYNVTDVRTRTVALAPNYVSPYIGDFIIPEQVTDTTTQVTYTVTSIADYCFAASGPRITSITMPNTIKTIGNQIAPGCTGLKKVVFSNTLESIGDGAFASCISLDSVSLPSSLKTLKSSVFSGCSKLETVDLGTGIAELPMMCFYGTAVKNINISDNIQTLGNSVFGACKNLKSVHFGKGLTKIGDNDFSGCDSLSSITVDEENPAFYASEAVLYNKAQDTLYFRLAAAPGTEFTVPSTVKVISQWAFDSNKLNTITLPEGLTTIGRAAFENTPITSIELPSTLDSLGLQAFNYCTKLKEITVPERVKYIADQAFYGCSSLEKATLHAGIVSVGNYAFANDTILDSLTINAVIPPTASSSSFEKVNVSNVNLIVPTGSEDAYKAADVWKDFFITTTTGINKIAEIEKKSKDVYYNIAGQRVNKEYKGIVIVNGHKYLNK